jgi:hypothetical protein
MRAKEFITESSNTNLLIVDVQPEYDSASRHILSGVQNMIAKSNAKIVVVYNDFGGGDSADDVFNYLAGHDAEYDGYEYDDELDDYVPMQPSALEQKLQRAEFIHKEYGFLRGFMDTGISDNVIIEAVRAMYSQNVSDSRDLDLSLLSQQAQQELENTGENIGVQDWVSIRMLKALSPFYMMGGGREECLREIELICHAFNIKFKRIDSLTY